jgi:hypothetical protein
MKPEAAAPLEPNSMLPVLWTAVFSVRENYLSV